MPNVFLEKLSYIIYILLYKIFSYRLDVVKTNLFHAFPDKSSLELMAIEQKFYKHLSNIILQHIQAISFDKEELKKRIWLHHQAKFDLIQAEKSNQPIFIVAAHYGNWEYAVLLTALETKLTAFGIFKPLNNKTFNQFLIKNRSKFGLRLVEINQIKSLIFQKHQQHTYCFIADQTPVNTDAAFKTKFLDVPNTPFYKGFAELAVGSNAIIFYASIHPIDEKHYEIKLKKIEYTQQENEVEAILTQYVSYLEQDIKQQPEFWLWTHKRWKRAGIHYK